MKTILIFCSALVLVAVFSQFAHAQSSQGLVSEGTVSEGSSSEEQGSEGLVSEGLVTEESTEATTQKSENTPIVAKALVEDEKQQQVQKAKTSIADQVQELKKRVVDLNRELFILEEDLLFPASTQIAVFVSVDVGHFFKLDSMKLSVNGEDVTSHLYTEREISALTRGAIQRLYTGNVKTGEHEVAVYLHGFGPENRPYKLAASILFEKDDEPVRLEVKVIDSTKNFQPKIEIVNWED